MPIGKQLKDRDTPIEQSLLVSHSQTAFFRLHLGGEKGSGPVSIGYSFLTPPTAMGSVNEFQHLLPTTWY